MEALSLRRDEAVERCRLLDVQSYAIDLDLTRGDEVFGSSSSIRFTCLEPGASTFVELRDASSATVTLNGRHLDGPAGNRIALPGLAADNVLVVEAELPYVTTGDGMHRYVDPLDDEVYVGAYLGVDNAQRVFACFDQPDLKAPISVEVTAPSAWKVLSNGLADQPAPGRWRFATTPPISVYMMAVIAGPLHSISLQHKAIPFGVHARKSVSAALDEQAGEIFDLTVACFDRYAEMFAEPYAFDSYDSVFVPELNWGAMEQPGCVLFRDEFVFRSAVTDTELESRATVIAHEMAHMWFGDLVTMRWWDDLWLSEAFAEYMGFQILTEATRFQGSWTAFAMTSKAWGYDSDQRSTTHPISPEPEDVVDTETALANFDGISYAKGASVVRQLVGWLGQEAFQAGVNDLIAGHRFGVICLQDLLDSLSRASGLDVTGWSDPWLRATGVDTLRVVDGFVEHPGLRTHAVSVGDEVLMLPAGSGPIAIPQGPALLNHRDLTFAKVRYDADTMAWIADGLSSISDPLSRAVVWTNLRDLTRDAEMAPQDYLAMVTKHLPAEIDLAILKGVLAFALERVIDRFLTGDAREQAIADYSTTCWRLLGTAPEVRLTAVRGLAATLRASELVSWLEAGSAPGGPILDADLRWRVLRRLSVLGAVDVDIIDEQERRDVSGDGSLNASRCRASLPSAAAKEAAWHEIFDPADGLSTYVLTASVQGFWQPEHAAVLRPYLDRWFPAAIELAGRRGTSIASALARASLLIDPHVLELGRQAVARPDLPGVLKRDLIDRVDDLAREVRVLTTFG